MIELTRVCVFCGASAGSDPRYADAGAAFGRLLAEHGIGLVYGASSMGMMAAVANAVLDEGGEAIGVIPKHLLERERPKTDLTELEVVDTMHERKARMFELSDGFVALPGGLGTLEELFEIATWSQLGLHTKPVGVLDIDGYFSGLVGFLDHAVDQGFISSRHRELLLVDDDGPTLLRRLRDFEAPPTGGWLDEEDL